MEDVIWVDIRLLSYCLLISQEIIVVLKRYQVALTAHYLLDLWRQRIFPKVLKALDTLVNACMPHTWVKLFVIFHRVLIQPFFRIHLVLPYWGFR